MKKQSTDSGFKRLIDSVMRKRMIISSIILLTFLGIIVGIGVAISTQSTISEVWKEFLLLLLGAFIGSYGKIIDYWFSDTDKDKMLVQKMDEEDGVVVTPKKD
jgi:H+/Cl- antiporter ClcA